MVQVAHGAAHRKNGKLKKFFLRIQKRKGYNIAIVALDRKMLAIIHHLLTNMEFYEDIKHKKKSVCEQAAFIEETENKNVVAEIIKINKRYHVALEEIYRRKVMICN